MIRLILLIMPNAQFSFHVQVLVLEGEKNQVSCLAASPDNKHLAVGYSDGSIKIFNLTNGDLAVTFSGHKTAVSALNYDHLGMRLVSGAMVSNLHDSISYTMSPTNGSLFMLLSSHSGH